jgi:hypothetical protein
MKLTCTIDTDAIGDETSFEDLLTDALKRDIINKAKDKVALDQFKNFSDLVSDTLVAEIKLALQNFLADDIVLTDRWGKKEFVGTIEDLIRTKIDDVLTRPVDSSGKTLTGCTSSTQTWIEWIIKNKVELRQKQLVEAAETEIRKQIKNDIKNHLDSYKDGLIKEQVSDVFANYLTGTKKEES